MIAESVRPTPGTGREAGTFLPFNRPDITDLEIGEVVDTLQSGWLTTGPKTKAFEQRFAAYLGATEAIAVNSCTAAMHVALAAAGIGPGDEVIVPAMTFAATANVVLHQHARPVVVDVSPDTLNIDPAAIEAAISPRTRAIMPVHLYGHPCDMDRILAIARRHRLLVIEDAAHAIGAHWHNQPIGTLGTVTAFSFYATKNLVTGEGGMITTNDEAFAAEMRRWVLHGMSRDAWDRYSEHGSWYYEIVAPGFKYNMTDLQASLGLHQLTRLEAMNCRRERLVQIYRQGLGDLPELELPVTRSGVRHAWHLYAIRLHLDRLAINRDVFIEELRRAGIGASVHFIPLHRHPYYQDELGLRAGEFPVAEATFPRLVSLPLYSRMTDADAEDVVLAVRRIVEQHSLAG
jgi:perosamine synthetase